MTDTATRLASRPLPASAVVEVTDRLIVRVSGPGTHPFLHGQFSQSLEAVTDHSSPRAAACSPKGRAYCLTRLVRDGDDILMELPTVLAEDTLTHLRKYMMLFRGTTMEADPAARILGLLGQPAANALSAEAETLLKTPGDTLALGPHRLVRTQDTGDGLPRFELWQQGPLQPSLADALAGLTPASLADWQASEIAAGVATLNAETSEAYVPQMLNWQHVGGVHFKKGCYTGQEVIARMHFLGQLKKSLFRLGIDRLDALPAPGEPVMAGGRSVGEVVNAVGYRDGSGECLAVIRHDSARDGALTVAGYPLRVLGLPYEVPEQTDKQSKDT